MDSIEWVQERVLQRSDILPQGEVEKNLQRYLDGTFNQPYVSVRLVPRAEEREKEIMDYDSSSSSRMVTTPNFG